ncbi:MAG TPA: DegT/DnrJ/EryC1/StrS family aminotransferase [Jatrophihabitans sp.]|nr:DegT/DnrJ/EryC1/StrS family aminotransferase [Jatrophihabitans sp.]
MTGSETAVPAARIVFTDADRAEIGSRIEQSLTTGALTLGPNTVEFEETFAKLHRAPFAVAVSSGTAALEIILRSLEIRGQEVVVPANTFAATAFAVLGAGGRPVFADVDPATLALSVETVAAAITPDTAAVVLVHIGGLISPEVQALRAFCDDRGITLIEDAAHAHGSTHAGRPAGSFGTAAAFSFYPTKVITSGEGGMIVTADERLRDEALAYRDQGKAGFLGNRHVRLGYAWRLSELHAAVGLVQLRHLPEFLDVRRGIAERYTAGLRELGGLTPLLPPAGSTSNFYKYVVLPSGPLDRAGLRAELRERHAVSLSGEVYEVPLHQQPVFAEWAAGPLPVAEDVCARHFCLPLHSDMTDAEADRVLAALAEVLPGLRG